MCKNTAVPPMEGFALNSSRNASRLVQELKKLRKRAGFSQQALAVRLGIALPTVSRWENGKSHPSPLALEKIEAFLREMGKDGEAMLKECFAGNTGRKA